MGKILKKLTGLVILPVLIAYSVYWQIYPLFGGEFTQQLGSIEVSYISMGSFLSRFYPHLSWQPLWYFGYPFYLLYTPFLPFLEWGAHVFLGFSESHAYRFFTAAAYVLVPVTLYFLIFTITKDKLAGLLTALFYATVPSHLGYFFPVITEDKLGVLLEPRRFAILVRWGEGPHTVALLFAPLAALFFYFYIERGRFRDQILGSLFSALVALTNAVALWGVGTLFFAILVEAYAKGAVKVKTIGERLIRFGLLIAGLSAFWYHPAFVGEFFSEGSGTVNVWLSFFPWNILGLIILLALYILILRGFLKKTRLVITSLTWFLLMFIFVYIYYASGEDRLELVPQVLRLNTEADMALAMLVGSLYALGANYLGKKGLVFRFGGLFVGVVVVTALFYRNFELAKVLPQFTVPLEATGKSLADTPEYRVAKKLESLAGAGERVFAPGNYSFFLNYFTNVAQVRGGLFQSSIDPWPDHIYYQVANGESSEISLALLKIANVSYLVYTSGASGEPFKDYKVSSEKFDRVLKRVEEEKGDIYYEVPLVDSSLAKVVDKKLMSIQTPRNAIDEKPLYLYTDLIEENPGKAKLSLIDNRTYKIEADTSADELILVQMSYHKGWKAYDNEGRRLTIFSDPLGFLVIDPLRTGEIKITLRHDTIMSQYLGYVVSMVTFALLLFISLRKILKLRVRKDESS